MVNAFATSVMVHTVFDKPDSVTVKRLTEEFGWSIGEVATKRTVDDTMTVTVLIRLQAITNEKGFIQLHPQQ